MPVEPFKLNGALVDLGQRIQVTSTVLNSPSGASETIVATTGAFDTSVAFSKGVLIQATLAYTLGTSASACTIRVRQGTGTGGTVIYSTGAQTGGHNSAGLLVSDELDCFDTAPAAGQQYTVTLTVTGGAAASTVSAVQLIAIAF